MRMDWEGVGAGLAVVTFFVGVGSGIACVSNMMRFVSAEAAIEQLRDDASAVGVNRSEDVIGQVTAWNQKIVTWQRWNRVPVLCLYVPNGWDRIKPIAIPKD